MDSTKEIKHYTLVTKLEKLHHKFSMWRINNENRVKFIHLEVCTFYTQISCIENTFDTWINVLTNEIQTYEWMSVTQISHLPINPCVKCVFNAWYQCVILGEKPHFSTMFSTNFQLSFIVENIVFNYKMLFATQKWRC
jgi:hypothetical protein